jgi:putative ABC transport system permease protein
MAWHQRTPLAWKLLVHNKKRMLLSITGVAFAVFLMFIEMGFLNGVYDSQTLLMGQLNADLIMFFGLKDALNPLKPFQRQRLTQTLQFDEVEEVFPLYLARGGGWKAPYDRIDPISAIGIDPNDRALLLPELDKYREVLKLPDTAISDRRSRKFYGALRPGNTAELNGRRINIVGDFALGPDFIIDGRLIMSDRNFVKFFPNWKTGKPDFNRIELGLIKVKPGVDVQQLKLAIQATLPPDIRVVTRQEMVAEEKTFWANNQPVGLIFGLGMIVGFIIGVTICYQILFTDVNDHEAEFATLKAIGYANSYLVGIVLREGLYLSLLAFFPGLLLSFMLYSSLEEWTGIAMRLTTQRVILVFVLTVVMCLVSAMFAIRKVLSSDPAEVF